MKLGYPVHIEKYMRVAVRPLISAKVWTQISLALGEVSWDGLSSPLMNILKREK
jgi:hypothetical protein